MKLWKLPRIKDRVSAMTPTSDPRGDFLAKATVGIVVLIIVLVFALVFLSEFGFKVDTSLMTLVGQVVATALAFGTAVWAFQFGSSKGSQDKDAVIANSTPIVTPPAGTTTVTTTTSAAEDTAPATLTITPKE